MYETVINSYRQTSYLTADPLKLVLLCYKGAIANLRAAKEAYLQKDYERKARALQKTIDIIHELNSSLDMEKGGNIARNLRGLYHFMTQTLIEADLKQDTAMFERIITLLQELESAWMAVAKAPTADKKMESEPKKESRPVGISQNVLKPVMERAWNA
ncbi:MAG: flagellar export chaperone FliS [Syntrophales bacterium]|nr:flagellar export chaperone FliS [Syntrophales bacterium]